MACLEIIGIKSEINDEGILKECEKASPLACLRKSRLRKGRKKKPKRQKHWSSMNPVRLVEWHYRNIAGAKSDGVFQACIFPDRQRQPLDDFEQRIHMT